MSHIKTGRTQSADDAPCIARTLPFHDHAVTSAAKPVMPAFQRPLGIAVGGLTAVGVVWAAAYVSKSGVDRGVGITAWVTAAIVGTVATIAAAKNA